LGASNRWMWSNTTKRGRSCHKEEKGGLLLFPGRPLIGGGSYVPEQARDHDWEGKNVLPKKRETTPLKKGKKKEEA